jgi:glutathione S-transferase
MLGGTATLLTFAPMVDSEFCRLLLRHYGIAYREERHIFAWVSLLALVRARSLRIPAILGVGSPMVAPAALFARMENTCLPGLRLAPAGEPSRTNVQADWQRYNGELAAHVAVLAYHNLLPHRELMEAPVTHGAPPWEARFGRATYPAFRWLLSTLLRLNAPRAADAQIRIRSTFDYTDDRIADGRLFLAGSDLTIGDLALASAAAPLLRPAGYTAPIPAMESVPVELRLFMNELRARPTARLVERIYAAIHERMPAPENP